MKIKDKVCVITGGASGIGAALARKFADEGAAAIYVADVQEALLSQVAEDVGGVALTCDATSESDIQTLIDQAEAASGQIAVFCSNAGVIRLGSEQAPDDEWQLCWDLHLMAHVYAARVLAPKMAARGEGYLVNTASAAGLLSHVNSATYTVTKHAAIAFAEWLSIKYGHDGVRVSALCPQAVKTAMTAGREGGAASVNGMITAEYLAQCTVESMDREEFLILPHPEVLDYMQRKSADVDRWLGGMRKYAAMYPEGI